MFVIHFKNGTSERWVRMQGTTKFVGSAYDNGVHYIGLGVRTRTKMASAVLDAIAYGATVTYEAA